ncbi:hypothetical protein H0264_20030 [Nocardia huaxiensis]|uniref:Uncharacterized protein n=1 Tax=Nocardia huaxiensis TaxID=2755382 RepID=A0A7D6Z665_9NOCA|nr:hypothetical protein [Nocardia huaxiensis]QLY27748.1 hypothetical protein H0264_20030 [Nocardia huaxiensis]
MTAYPVPSAPRRGTPVGWWLAMVVILGLGAAGCLWLMWISASSGDTLDAMLTGFMPMAGLFAIWLTLAVVGGVSYRIYWPSIGLPLVLATTLVVLWLGVPGKLGWMASRSALDQAAASCTESTGAIRIGVYTFDRVQRLADGCRFDLADAGFLSNIDGFVRLPSGPPEPAPGKRNAYRYAEHDGQWHTYVYVSDYSNND